MGLRFDFNFDSQLLEAHDASSLYDRHENMRKALYSALLGIALRNPPELMRHLAISNVIADIDIFDRYYFLPWIGRLASLSLSVAGDRIRGDVDSEESVSRFWATTAPIRLLKPAQHLTSLSLSSDQSYGHMPFLDVTGLHFPHLISLSLRHFLFCHPGQGPCDMEDFITGHCTTLRNLTLESCPMFLDENGPQRTWYDTWSHLEAKLEVLRHFEVSWDHEEESDQYFVSNWLVGYVHRSFSWDMSQPAESVHHPFPEEERDERALERFHVVVNSRKRNCHA